MLPTLAKVLLERLATCESRDGVRLPVEVKVAMVELWDELHRMDDPRRGRDGIQMRRNKRVVW